MNALTHPSSNRGVSLVYLGGQSVEAWSDPTAEVGVIARLIQRGGSKEIVPASVAEQARREADRLRPTSEPADEAVVLAWLIKLRNGLARHGSSDDPDVLEQRSEAILDACGCLAAVCWTSDTMAAFWRSHKFFPEVQTLYDFLRPYSDAIRANVRACEQIAKLPSKAPEPPPLSQEERNTILARVAILRAEVAAEAIAADPPQVVKSSHLTRAQLTAAYTKQAADHPNGARGSAAQARLAVLRGERLSVASLTPRQVDALVNPPKIYAPKRHEGRSGFVQVGHQIDQVVSKVAGEGGAS
jgi:hypothetical protein